jgi:membrane-associated phospholipid phosphatase
MLKRFLILLVALTCSSAHADDPYVEQPYQVDLQVDLPLFIGGTALWLGPTLFIESHIDPSICSLCDSSKVNAFDRRFINQHSSQARLVANLVYAVPISATLLDMLDVGPSHWKGYLSDYLVVAESLVWQGAVQELVRHAIRRPRPFLYSAGVYPAERQYTEATLSFYSGHTSSVFDLVFAFSYTYSLRHPDSPWRFVVWGTLLTLATAEPILRVASGDHFPTDVVIGAVVGAAFGLAVPALHRRSDTLIPGLTALRIQPMVQPGSTAVALVGSF